MKHALASCMKLASALLGAWLLGWTAPAWSHEISMAELEVREVTQGDFLLQWAAGEKRPADEELTPEWPAHCKADGNRLHCGAGTGQGLQGELAMQGVGRHFSAAMVKVYWLDGQSRVYTLTASQPKVHLHGTADDRRGMGEIASAYTMLGIEHILTGFDHLLFVIGLLFLVGLRRRLLWTITAFTVAHSLTLALSALGWLSLRAPPVEASIALSIMLVAGEALHERPTASRRWPALVALLFGLVHGLGFAGALKEIGLPPQHLPIALLTFNVGVELGQLMVVTCALGFVRLLGESRSFVRARRPALYAMGGIAAYWTLTRLAAMLA